MRPARLVSALLLACLALSACQKDPVGPVDPDDTATPSVTATPTPTPTGPTPPPMPEAANRQTLSGAVLFTRHYVELLNYTANSGDTGPLTAVSAACSGCDKYAALYSRIYADGGYYKTSGWVPETVTPSELEGSYGVEVQVRAPAAEFQESASSEVARSEPATYLLQFTARHGTDGWRMVALRNGTQ